MLKVDTFDTCYYLSIYPSSYRACDTNRDREDALLEAHHEKKELKLKEKAERREKREQMRRDKKMRQKEKQLDSEADKELCDKIAFEERKLLLAQRRLESIRLLDELLDRIKVRRELVVLGKLTS